MTQQSHYWAYTLRKPQFKKTHIPTMFMAALFIIVRTWKQARCASTDERIKKMWYIYTMEYYSDIKRSEIGSFVEMWMNLERVMQSDRKRKTNIIYEHMHVEFRKWYR